MISQLKRRKNKVIESIRLKNFRRHEDILLQFDPTFNLIYGRNNAGKTTIFYAIEYCLFGGVGGFKKIAQLAKFKQNSVGVELIFKGKDGSKYKLQRMHKLKGKTRSATGFFTLKKLVSESEEKYILASDFGNHEEDLALKLLEILGMSKRFFETGVHFSQGEISNILTGDKKLDIVFGITSATALAKMFGSRALDFEKEVKVLDTFEAIIKQAKKEKQEQTEKLKEKEDKENTIKDEIKKESDRLEQLKEFKKYSEQIGDAVNSLEEIQKTVEEANIKTEMIKKELEEIKNKFGSVDDLKKNFNSLNKIIEDSNDKIKNEEKEISKLQQKIQENKNKKVELDALKKQEKNILKEKESLLEPFETKENLAKKIEHFKDEYLKTNENLNELEKAQKELQTFFRTIEREKGNISGILERRKSNKDNQECEYCGAPIDASKITEEIKECKKKLKDFDSNIDSNEKNLNDISKKLLKQREKEKQSYQEYLKKKNLFEQINDLEEKINNLSEKDLNEQIQHVTTKIEKYEKLLQEKKTALNDLREEHRKKEKELNDLNSSVKQVEKQNSKMKEIQKDKKDAEENLTEGKRNLIILLNTVKTELDKYIKLLGEDDGVIKPLKVVLNQIDNFKSDLSLKAATKLKEDFNELIISKMSEISSSLKHLEEQKVQLKKDLEDIKDKIKRLDKQIAVNEKKIQILLLKEKLAEKYRYFQNVFKKTQGIIRDNISNALEERILDYHKVLSSEEEFEKIFIDSDDYSLSVTPKGMSLNTYYPAWVYEGGGHKLLLGLSYKFSLSELINVSSFLLIDEPTEFIDINNRKNLLSNISSMAENTQVILITHQDVDKIVCNNKIELKK